MANDTGEKKDPQAYVTSILNDAVQVITHPVDFFRQMPKTGGYTDPLIFLVVMGFAAGIVQAVLSIFGFGIAGGLSLIALVAMPVLMAIFGFIAAAILFVIWKLMGAEQSYEVAYRCSAYAAAICPLTTIVHPIPYLGGLIGLAWGFYLVIVASTETAGIEPKKAQIVFGAIGVVLCLLSLSSEYTARQFTAKMSKFNVEEMTPEEAGKKVGEFMKGLQKGAKE